MGNRYNYRDCMYESWRDEYCKWGLSVHTEINAFFLWRTAPSLWKSRSLVISFAQFFSNNQLRCWKIWKQSLHTGFVLLCEESEGTENISTLNITQIVSHLEVNVRCHHHVCVRYWTCFCFVSTNQIRTHGPTNRTFLWLVSRSRGLRKGTEIRVLVWSTSIHWIPHSIPSKKKHKKNIRYLCIMVYLLNIPWIVIQKLYHECIPFDSLVRILVNFLPILTTTAAQAAGTKFGFRSVPWTRFKGKRCSCWGRLCNTFWDHRVGRFLCIIIG